MRALACPAIGPGLPRAVPTRTHSCPFRKPTPTSSRDLIADMLYTYTVELMDCIFYCCLKSRQSESFFQPGMT